MGPLQTFKYQHFSNNQANIKLISGFPDVPLVSNKYSGELINISPYSLTVMNTINIEFSSVEGWFTDQTSKALEIEDNVNLTIIIGQSLRV